MPLYEYECQSCRERLETIQRFSDDPYTICPHCGGELRKLISSPAIQFKGSGFYITDYGKSGATGKSEKAGGESKTETSATKPGDD